MALRDKLRERVQPYLQPGEQVEQVFLAQGGITPWLASGALGLVGAMAASRRVIVVTNQAILVVDASKLTGTTPTRRGVIARLPRQAVIGPPRGVWAKVRIGDEKLYVHKRFHRDISQANERAGTASGEGDPH
jgi:hypothetical protein